MNEISSLVQQIHATPHKSVLAVAGAGSQAVSWLLGVSGASRTILEALVPYGRGSMIDLLGTEPEQYVSSGTARDMARAAYRRGMQLVEDGSLVVGVAATATIATDRTKRGDHRCCIATWDRDRSLQFDLVLDKGARDRSGEEALVSRSLLLVLARSFGIDAELELGLTGEERPRYDTIAHPPPVERLISGDVRLLSVDLDGGLMPQDPIGINIPRVIFPGSFSPLHHGHETLARVVSQMVDAEVAFEISVTNVDKPALDDAEIRRRIGQFRGNWRVLLTRAETFYQKAGLIPGSTFVVGWDTAVRLVDPRYYGDREADMLAALANMWTWGTRFLVAGRLHQGKFMSLADVPVPQGFHPMFQPVPESSFRVDLSSTELRARGGPPEEES